MILRKNKGFSLMELLIVIALIGILTAVVSVSFSFIQKKSRDARRIGDMKAVQNAFEQYYVTNKSYPSSCVMDDTDYLPGGTPTDPKGGASYVTGTCNATQYCFCASLEVAITGGVTCGDSPPTNAFCVRQLQ